VVILIPVLAGVVVVTLGVEAVEKVNFASFVKERITSGGIGQHG
jgi:hypothetical protein